MLLDQIAEILLKRRIRDHDCLAEQGAHFRASDIEYIRKFSDLRKTQGTLF